MNKTRSTELHDYRVNEKVVLSGLWITMLFVFAFVDIFAFWRSDVINGALIGKVPATGFTINQGFLVFTTVYILVPSLMIAASLLFPAKVNRVTNIVVSLLFIVAIVVAVIGETWIYYILGSVIEIVLLAGIAYVAWTWQKRSQAADQS